MVFTVVVVGCALFQWIILVIGLAREPLKAV